MVLPDDVIALVHDLSSDGLAVTLIGPPVKRPKGSNQPQYQSLSKSEQQLERYNGINSAERSKSTENCKARFPSRYVYNDEKPDVASDNESKKKKYSSMCGEVWLNRDSEVIHKKLSKKLDVRYINQIKNFKEKIKSSYVLSCNQQQCPIIQERLTQHQLMHHLNTKKIEFVVQRKNRDKAINVSPTLSRMRLPKFTLPFSHDGRLVQTEITMRDFSPSRFPRKQPNRVVNFDRDISLKRSETREVLSKRNFYKEHLQNEILNWLHHVPMFYSLNFTIKDIKHNVVHNLAEKLNSLVSIAHEPSYEMKVKVEIENCLNKLPMWLHGTKRDQMLFKEGLREKLWNKIKGINENFLGIKYEKTIGPRNVVVNDDPMAVFEREAMEWSQKLQLDPAKGVTKRNVVALIMKRLTPLLKIPLNTTSYKLILKGEIIDILDDTPLALTSQKFRTVYLNRLAEDLTNRLLAVQVNKKQSNNKTAGTNVSVFHQCAGQIMGIPIPKTLGNLKELITDRVGECLEKIKVCHRNDLQSEICSSFLDSKACLRAGDEVSIKDEICQYLRDTGRISGERTQIVANMIMEKVKDVIHHDTRHSAATSFDSVIPQLSSTVTIYRWGFGKKKTDAPVTSTPIKSDKKEISKLSPEETSYIDNVSKVIRSWMDTLPKQYNEDVNFKETIIRDLAGDLMDHFKVDQLAPEAFPDKDKYQKYVVYRWLYKFNFYDDDKIAEEAKPRIADFLKRLNGVPVPNLTASQHGTRQAMGHIKHMEGEKGWEEDYVPKGVDVLEDQISVWLNEQPSEIYSNKDKNVRDKMVHELALNMQDRLRNKSPESEIDKDINSWVKKMVKYKEREHVGVLSQNLKERIIDTPQDQTLQGRQEERQRYMAAKIAEKRQKQAGPSDRVQQDVSNVGNIQGDPDRTIREFIPLFIQRHYNIDDPLIFNAFAHLLKTELRLQDVNTRKEIYEYFEQSKVHERFRPEKYKSSLDYYKIISNWLNDIPIEKQFNTPDNKTRIEFINDLAKNIEEIEEQRYQNPNAMEYNYLTASMILQTMHTYGLPILPEHKDNTPLMVEQLLQRLAERRPISPRQTPRSQARSPGNESNELSQSLNASDIKEQNLSDFIDDYIRINGAEIADDDIKFEIWTSNLYKEVNKMIKDGMNPSAPNKALLYEKFADVPIPSDEDVNRCNYNTKYREDIIDWMHNLPIVLPNFDFQEKRFKMIAELSEKMCETDLLRRAYPNDKKGDKKLESYIGDWVSKLPLDKNRPIVLPIVTQQLMSRMDRVNNILKVKSSDNVINSSSNSSNSNSSIKSKKDNKQNVSKGGSKSSICSLFKSKKTPAESIVETIESWCNKLPIKDKDKGAVKKMKQGIARNLYQKTTELNLDPKVFNDDLLYREMLGDEIDTQLENVPQNPELQKNREKLKENLINSIMETNKVIKEKSTGENYRNKLETTLDASIPNPVQSTHMFDPGFELYKNHLASMFILENFDHANEDVKAKYENQIKQETDKYFESARNRNALPLTKDQIYNELYSALFKVPMPNETSVIDEVEQVKTRCVIDGWYESLPVQHTDNLTELLERDRILSTLAKRIHDIEKTKSCKVDDHILKETRKWLDKLPLTAGHEGHDVYAKKLLKLLKSTSKDRKYVPADKTCKGKCNGGKGVKNKKESKKGPQLQSKATHAKPCIQATPMAHKKPGDIIVEIVDEWCNQLPLNSTEEQNKVIRDNISTRIIIQISELNMDPEIFNDDVVYTELLDEELEGILSNIPVDRNFENTKIERKHQLITKIISIKPLIKEEKARHEYKQELNSTVASILTEPQDTTEGKRALFNQLKEEIVENFVQFNYNKHDEEGRKLYKKQLNDAILKYCANLRKNCQDEKVDPLVRRNQLLCELEKIPVPQTALKEEVAEIKMRKEVDQLLRQQSVPEGEPRNKMKKHLAKRLCDIEKSGYTPSNEKKMKVDITRCFKKLDKDISSKDADDFINKLKNNESERKAPPLTSSQAGELNTSTKPSDTSGSIYVSRDQVLTIKNREDAKTPQKHTSSQIPSQVDSGEQWVSLPETVNRMPNSCSPACSHNRTENRNRYPPAANQFDQSVSQPVDYNDFEGGNFVSSSKAAPNNYAKPPSCCQNDTRTSQKQNSPQIPPQYDTSQGEQWISLPETVNRMPDSSNQPSSYSGTENRSRYPPAASQFDQSVSQPVDYNDFEGGNFVSSSKAAPNNYAKSPCCQNDTRTSQKQNTPQIPPQYDTSQGEQWISLPETVNRMPDSSNQPSSYSGTENRSRYPPAANQFDQSGSQPVDYNDFEGGNFVSSSKAAPNNYAKPSSCCQNDTRTSQKQNSPQRPPQYDTSQGEQWISLPETVNRMPNSSYQTPSYPGPDNRSRYPAQQFDQSVAEPGNYSDFEGGNFLNSSKAPPNYYSQTPGQVPAQFGVPNNQPDQRSMNQYYQSPQQPQQAPRESSPTSFGQMGTPRQVGQSPGGAHSPQEDPTPESLFQTPVFRPVPFQRQLVVPPSLEPSPVQGPPGSTPAQNDPQSPMPGSANPRCLSMLAGRRMQGFKGDEEVICVCERCTGKNCKGIPLCVLAMQKYFEDCLGIPVCMHFPECFRQ
ncbi:uncharacterized protein LOC118280083 isoform X2 [Spodoptera frugiperda]|uniref:Uncharacterized protein LOC118280083 isoform X2 n=1 Tax=Spodoptera frugiperda TaxID=7108 RepID=A0A9R0DJ81_SPOFR|nr:uncharacterized protein LOC118280083 isoform X2 [Spodoptera frugiperda]